MDEVKAGASSSSSSSSTIAKEAPTRYFLLSALGVIALSVVVGVWVAFDPSLPTTVGNIADAASKHKVFTTTELAEFDGKVEGKTILLAVLGQVFDVTTGKRFYAPPSGYAFFSGKDGSRAFVTGEFEGTGVVPAHQVADLTDEQLVTIEDWRLEYHNKYIFVGVLYQADGYYTVNGSPTALLKDIERRVKDGRILAGKQEDYRKSVPGCNSYFKSGEGGKLWCDNGLFPRKGKLPLDRDVRCACYTKEFADKHKAELKVARQGCDPDSHECAVPADATD